MYTPDEIFEAACSIRPELPRLLGPKATDLDQQLAELLNQDRSIAGLENQVISLLAVKDATREWMQSFLAKPPGERAYQTSITDSGNLIPLPKFVCPYGDYIWYRHSVGEIPRPCPTHGIPPERVEE